MCSRESHPSSDPLNQLRFPRRALQLHCFAGHIGVFEAGSGIEEDYAIASLEKARLQQAVVRGGCRSSLRGKEYSFIACPIQNRGENLRICVGQRNAAGITQDLQHDGIAVRLGNAKTRGKGGSVFPHLAYLRTFLEGSCYRRTSSRL